MLASRVGFLEFIRIAMDESASPTIGYVIKVSNLNVNFEQKPVTKSYSEKGIDTTVYNLSGTRLSISFSSPLKDLEVGLYKLIEKCLSQYEERTSVSPTTFSIYTSYYGTLHGCVVQSFSISAEEGGPINISFEIVARYLDHTTKNLNQFNHLYMDLPATRNFMFYDIFLTMSPTYTNFHLPDISEFSCYMKGFSLDVTNDVQINWTLAEQTDIPSTLLPQSIVAPKDITIGSRTISGGIVYTMPYNDLLGFYKVLQNSTPLIFEIFDTFTVGHPSYMTIEVNNPIFTLPERPNDIGILQQTASFVGARSQTDTDYNSALYYTHLYI